MKELEDLVEDLKEHILFKEIASISTHHYDSYINSELTNRHMEIMAFEEAIKHVETSPLHKRDIILEFQKKALAIKIRIAEIPKYKV